MVYLCIQRGDLCVNNICALIAAWLNSPQIVKMVVDWIGLLGSKV